MITNRRDFIATLALLAVATVPGVAAAAQLPSYYLLEFADPLPGRAGDFDAEWMVHLTTMLATPGFLEVTPYVRSSVELGRPSAAPLPSRLAFYTLETADLPALGKRVRGRIDSGRIAKVAAEDPASLLTLLYLKGRSWTATTPPSAGEAFRQLVIIDAMPGQDDRYNRWFEDVHAGQLLTVPGVFEVERGVLSDVALTPRPAAPRYLAVMGFRTTSISQFSDILERTSRSLSNSDSYDGAHAWRHLFKQAGPTMTRAAAGCDERSGASSRRPDCSRPSPGP